MVYTYDTNNPDRLSRIADLAPSASRPYGFKPKGVPSYYGYDNAGNMTSDGHKDLTVAYNALNLPDVFTFANISPSNKIEITYNAAGEKLEKQVYTGATLSLHKRYVMGIEYTGTTLEAIYHAEGRIVPVGGGVFRYEYTLKDHLGNSRVSFAANGSAIQLLQENHQYPFGMEMKGAWITQVGTENGYQYTGKELNEDWGLNWSDYGARWYDASVGRWNSVDPLAEKYINYSGYAYVGNMPMVAFDPDGERIVFVNGFTGDWTGSDEPGEPYWGQNSEFVIGAQKHYNDNSIWFTNKSYKYITSNYSLMRKDGRKYAEENYQYLTLGMNKAKEVFHFVTHSMGGAFAEGMIDYLKEMGWIVESTVHISTWEAYKVQPNKKKVRGVGTEVTQAVITNDLVQNMSGYPIKARKYMPNVDRIIEKKSEKSLNFRHKDWINDGKLWEEMRRAPVSGPTWSEWGKIIDSWLKVNPNIQVTKR